MDFKEIGSEFWLDSGGSIEDMAPIDMGSLLGGALNIGADQRLLLSGRTAIDYVLWDIQAPIKRVYMPSYCCQSMLQPFIHRGISMDFYDVILDARGLSYTIDLNRETDIFFASSYFGYDCTNMDEAIGEFKDRNIIVIEDTTHRLLGEPSHCKRADYLIASLRKWFALPTGGIAIKMGGEFKEMDISPPPADLVNKKVQAMIKKGKYIKGNYIQEDYIQEENIKDEFLRLFSEFNLALGQNYKNMGMDHISKKLLSKINIEEIREKRRQNADYLHSNLHSRLRGSDYIKPLFKDINIKSDCPLFVPIIIDEGIRDPLRTYLIKNDIFCPVHWPIPQGHKLDFHTEEIYKRELSLICDQRYGIKEMQSMMDSLEGFISTYD